MPVILQGINPDDKHYFFNVTTSNNSGFYAEGYDVQIMNWGFKYEDDNLALEQE